MDQASFILPTVLHDAFYFCHFHSTAYSKSCAFICHITVFLSTSRQQHPLYRTPFPFPLAPFRLLWPRPLPHLPNKVPTRNKASLFKGATASKVSPTFLFSSPSFFFFSHPALPALISLWGFAARFASALTDLWRFVEFAKIKKKRERGTGGGGRDGTGRGRQVSGVTGFSRRKMQHKN